ncbi:MAG: ATP-binding protein [Deltaproteobacteria bacterium]|nr:ATP-binding protein [Deltaproteobacteria bacterium]
MRFIDRAAELRFLEQAWEAPAAQLVVLYGRRRVGKTALLREFARGKPALYYMATRLPEPQQLREIGTVAGEFFADPLLRENGFRDWPQLLGYLARRRERFAFLLDEFPYLVEANPALASLWQKGWDEGLAASRAKVVLAGSSIAMMERETLAHGSPLYGRRTGQLKLEPFPFREARRFLPRYGLDDQVRAYAILGGIPYYLSRCDDRLPLLENARREAFARGGVLREEVEFLLREELQEPRVYFAILQALAQGKRKPAEIANATGLPHGTLSKYLSVLQSLRLVTREVPATEAAPEKSKKGLYAVADPFVRFWFRFVLGQRHLLEMDQAARAARTLGHALDDFAAPVYEEICRDEVNRGLLDETTGAAWTGAGRFWDRSTEVDVLAFAGDRRRVLLGECKWSRRPVGPDVLEHLEAALPATGLAAAGLKASFALFARAGFSPGLRDAARGRRDVVLVHGLSVVPP